jgi:RsmE family RNA methyltransferase
MINPVMILKATLSSIISKGYMPVLCSEKRPDLWADNLDKCDPCFIIGPEGGWSEDEYELFKEIPHISISPLITRAETAAIAVASQYLLSSRIKS